MGQGEYALLNDDFCECSDGSDEPGTSACEEEVDYFYCRDGGEVIHHTLIADGVCDCCDGSDEQAKASSRCPYSCKVVAKKGATPFLPYALVAAASGVAHTPPRAP